MVIVLRAEAVAVLVATNSLIPLKDSCLVELQPQKALLKPCFLPIFFLYGKKKYINYFGQRMCVKCRGIPG